ncbi:MAG: 8-amino-7-oxononanoate synthase [Gammaproteobacteria bacterium]|nr:8-amino-7-oxononanoate synthase [Gammaproteobacteria bacterium]
MNPRWESLARELDTRRAQHLYRTRRINDGPQGPELKIDGKSVLAFCSNDYLGLANYPPVIAALNEGARLYGAGSGAAHLVSGHSSAHHALEEELAAFTGRQRALLFSTGYMANTGTIAALAGRGDAVFQDRLNHASLIDGGLLSGARLQRYTHGHIGAIEPQLAHSSAKRKLIVSDGVFSMDGDLAPLPQLVACAEKHAAWLMLDDAHGLGVLGAGGRGCIEHFSLNAATVPILVGTLGKAFGTFGAFVAGDEVMIEYLIQSARSYIYTTAMPPAIAHATRTSLRLAQHEHWRREHLQELIARFRHGAQQLDLPLMDSFTPIQPLLVGDTQRAVELSAALYERGILISAIRPPTVPEGSARLRITFTAAHSGQQVDRLLSVLAEVL